VELVRADLREAGAGWLEGLRGQVDLLVRLPVGLPACVCVNSCVCAPLRLGPGSCHCMNGQLGALVRT
jgi:hypothetical protein